MVIFQLLQGHKENIYFTTLAVAARHTYSRKKKVLFISYWLKRFTFDFSFANPAECSIFYKVNECEVKGFCCVAYSLAAVSGSDITDKALYEFIFL